jgi:hypothetical protein
MYAKTIIGINFDQLNGSRTTCKHTTNSNLASNRIKIAQQYSHSLAEDSGEGPAHGVYRVAVHELEGRQRVPQRAPGRAQQRLHLPERT